MWPFGPRGAGRAGAVCCCLFCATNGEAKRMVVIRVMKSLTMLVLFQKRNAIDRRGRRHRSEKCVDIRQLRIGNDFQRVGGHLTAGLANILGESRKSQRPRSQSRSDATLCGVAVALV